MEHAKVVRNTMEGVWDTTGGVSDMTEGVSDTTEGIRNTTEDISNTTEGVRDVTEDVCAGSLIRAAHKSCPCNDDEEVGEDTERGDAKDN